MSQRQNPFIYGDPVPVDRFIGRRSEIRRITNRICSSGSSSALIGEPRSGKSSILKYIKAEENQNRLFGDWAGRLLFVEVDAQNLESDISPIQFWEMMLDRVKGNFEGLQGVTEAYRACKHNNWSAFALERFFHELNLSKHKIVLLLDEFGSLLDHPKLHGTDFYGKLRSLSTRFESFVLLLSSRYLPISLHNKTLLINPHGSPYFNFLAVFVVQPFSAEEVDSLLKMAGRRFTKQEKQFIHDLSGGHPYLLQVAASALWESYNDKEKDTDARQRRVADELYREANDTLGASWGLWSPKVKIAFMTIVLNEIPFILPERSFDLISLVKQLDDLAPEIRFLSEQGYISPDPGSDSGWRVRIKAFVWWLADELRRSLRSDESFEKWFASQEWDGLLTRGERENFKQTVRKVAPLLQDVIKALLSKPQ
jgi:hypothetical protein